MALLDLNINENGDLNIEQNGNISTDDITDNDFTLYHQLKVMVEKLFFYNNSDNKKTITDFIGKKIINNIFEIETNIENAITNVIYMSYPSDKNILFISPKCLIKDNIAYVYFIYINNQVKPEILKILTVSI